MQGEGTLRECLSYLVQGRCQGLQDIDAARVHSQGARCCGHSCHGSSGRDWGEGVHRYDYSSAPSSTPPHMLHVSGCPLPLATKSVNGVNQPLLSFLLFLQMLQNFETICKI